MLNTATSPRRPPLFISPITADSVAPNLRSFLSGGPSSATWGSGGRAIFHLVEIPQVTRLYRAFISNGATAGNNWQVALLSDSTVGPDRLVTSSSWFAQSGTNAGQFVNLRVVATNPAVNAQGFSSTDGQTFNMSTTKMNAGKMYVLSVTNTHGTSAHAVSSIDGGPTFTQRDTIQYNGSLSRETLLTAVPTTNFSGVLTINFGANTETGCEYRLYEFQNVDTTTNDGIVQTVTNSGTGTAASVTLAALGSANNATYGQFGLPANTTFTAGTGYFVGAAGTMATPTHTAWAEWRADGSTTVDGTAGTSVNWGAIAAEIKLRGTPTDGVVVQPGPYWLTLWCDGSTGTVNRYSPSVSTARPVGGMFVNGNTQGIPTATSGFATGGIGFVPYYGFTTIASP